VVIKVAKPEFILLSELLNLRAELKKNQASLDEYLRRSSVDAGDLSAAQKKKLQHNSELLQQAIQKLEGEIGERHVSVFERWLVMDPNSDLEDPQ